MEIQKTLNVSELTFQKNEEYVLKEEIGRGGWGIVYTAERSDQKIVALKFFGYTQFVPDRGVINNEIMLMMSLQGVEGN